jgi:hypothetical protein
MENRGTYDDAQCSRQKRISSGSWQLHYTIQLPDAEAVFFFYGTEAACGMQREYFLDRS